MWHLLLDVLGFTKESLSQACGLPAPFSREPECKRASPLGEGNRRQAVEGFYGYSTTIQTTSYLHKRTDRLSSLCVLIVEPNIFKLFLDTHSAIWYTKFKAIPHKDCATDASSNFSSDETKSGVNT